ncbi:MAG: hypothetical protein ACYC9S_03990 [Leptospirales bacterium]
MAEQGNHSKLEKLQKRMETLKEKRVQLKSEQSGESENTLKGLKRVKKALRRAHQRKTSLSKLAAPKPEGQSGKS